MLDELRTAKYGEHESNLGALIAYRIAEKNWCSSINC